MSTEPVVTANGIAAFVSALVVLGVALGLDVSDQLKGAIAGVVIILAPFIAAWWSRRKVTPLVEPKDEDGTPLVRIGGATPSAQARRNLK